MRKKQGRGRTVHRARQMAPQKQLSAFLRPACEANPFTREASSPGGSHSLGPGPHLEGEGCVFWLPFCIEHGRAVDRETRVANRVSLHPFPCA